jgi:hypothetical protein
MKSLLAWLHGIVTTFHNRFAALEAHAGLQTPPLLMHPEVAEAAHPTSTAPAPQPPAAASAAPLEAVVPASPAPPSAPAAPVVSSSGSTTTIKTQWGVRAYADFPTYAAFAELARLAGRGLTDPEISAWMAATGNGDPRTHTASGEDTTKIPVDANGANADLPFGSPRTDFSKIYERGRNHFLPGVPQTLNITAPATPNNALRLVFSGRGGSPGLDGVVTDSSANVEVAVKNTAGNVVGEGNLDARWAAQPGETFTVTLVSDKETQEDITLNVG